MDDAGRRLVCIYLGVKCRREREREREREGGSERKRKSKNKRKAEQSVGRHSFGISVFILAAIL